LRKWLFEMYV